MNATPPDPGHTITPAESTRAGRGQATGAVDAAADEFDACLADVARRLDDLADRLEAARIDLSAVRREDR